MRLPGPTYDRGMSSLGREQRGAVQVYEVQAQAALDTQTAKDAVYQELQKLGTAANSWIEARDTGAADQAVADYRIKVRELETVLDTTTSYRAEDLPAGIQYRREETVGGAKQLREIIPSWEVRTQLFDYYEQQARTDALALPLGTKK